MTLADYQTYFDCQDEVDRVYRDIEHWTRLSILAKLTQLPGDHISK